MQKIVIAVLIGFLSAALGGWLGYLLARIRDDRLRSVDHTMHLISEDFTTKRLRFLSTLRKLWPADLKTAANMSVEEFELFRRDCLEIINTYELICILKNNGHLDKVIY